MDRQTITDWVTRALRQQPITDLHTHCFSPRFGASRPWDGEAASAVNAAGAGGDGLLLWGIDELVTYHYLVAELYRVVPPEELPFERFWSMSKTERADAIWRHLFVDHTPLSEACRGVINTLQLLGLDPNEKDLSKYRRWYAQQDADAYVDRVMELSGVDSITMTNSVFDDRERELWISDPKVGDDPRFRAVLRVDPLLRDWPSAVRKLASWGFSVEEDFSGETIAETKRFLTEWIARMDAVYVAVSLPPDFRYPAGGGSESNRVLRDILLPALRDEGLPFAMMIGSKLRVNPELRDAGDMVGKADIESLSRICRDFPRNRFLVTMLSRENQHELCVTARKFPNLLIFGCWWFLNNPSLVEEITRMRLELLGTSFVPQHSDARILDQLIYKWDHTRRVLAKVLVDKYADVSAAGFRLTQEQVQRDLRLLLRDNFRDFVSRA